jgi:type II secretory pathway predicted ATPase ExeA
MLQLKLPDTVEIVYIANPSVSAEDILFVIAHELSLSVSKGATKHEVMHLLQDYLLQRHMENKQVVLFIEEAQGMPLDTLEEIRLLSNLETDENKLLQIILFGQPELDQNLAQRSIRQLRERITHNFDLEPLTRDEIHNYLNFRMREVGYTGPELINTKVAKRVEQHSAGLLRRINIIADKILLSAFSEGTHNLTTKHVTAAVNDSAFNQAAPRGNSRVIWGLGLLVVIALIFALYQTRPQWISTLLVDFSSKLELAVKKALKYDSSITDIAPQAVEAHPDKAPVESVTDADMNLAVEQPVAMEPVAQEQIIQDQLAQERAVQEQVVQEQVVQDQLAQEQAIKDQLAQEQAIQPVVATRQEIETPLQRIAAVAPQVNEVVQTQKDPPQADAINEQVDEDRILQNALDQAASSVLLTTETSAELAPAADYDRWLDTKLQESRDWLSQADRDSVSIQVLVRSKSAVRELVYYLRNEWPLDLSETYIYEVNTQGRSVYRVFYSEFDTLTLGRHQIELLPEMVKRNSPYLDSVYRMRKALL